MAELDGITHHHLVLLLIWHASESFCQDSLGIGPVRLHMREVPTPHNPVHSHLVAQTHPNWVIYDCPVFPCRAQGAVNYCPVTLTFFLTVKSQLFHRRTVSQGKENRWLRFAEVTVLVPLPRGHKKTIPFPPL